MIHRGFGQWSQAAGAGRRGAGRIVSGMARGLVFGVVAALVFVVYAAVDCALMERVRIRGLPRWAWICAIVLLPVVGAVLWFVIGRGPQPRPAVRVIGPDDDPAFLRSRAVTAPRDADEAEWRRFEQDLAGLDADPEDDGEQRRT